MSYTQDQLDKIKRAFASGVTRVSFDGNVTEYRSLADMQQIIATIEADLAAQSGRRPPVAGRARFSRI